MDKLLMRQLLRLTLTIASLSLLSFGLYISFSYLYPFLIALIVSTVLHPVVSFCEKRWKIKRGLTTLIVLMLFFFLTFFTSYLLIKRIIHELTDLFMMIPSYSKTISIMLLHIEKTYLLPFYSYIQTVLPLTITNDFSLTAVFIDKLQANMMQVIEHIMMISSRFLSSFAYTSFILLSIILATYFMTKDYELIMKLIRNTIPEKIKNLMSRMKAYAKQSVLGLIKTQIMIALLTVFISLIALSLFQVEHVLIMTSLIFIFDLIPYVGIGVIFLPWIIYSFFIGEYIVTIQLSALYILLIIIRQMIEPRLLAQNLGLHPLVTIVVLFLSINLFGAFGFIMTPFSLIILSSIYHTKVMTFLMQYIKEGSL